MCSWQRGAAPGSSCIPLSRHPFPAASLAGVTEGNYRALMREANSLAELADVPLERLATVMGGQGAAKRLHEFLGQECKALFGAL